MKIHYYAQAAYLITGDDGRSILIDPYKRTETFRYDPTFDEPDLLLVTHEHGDHNNVAAVPGDPPVVRGDGEHHAAGFGIQGMASFHDQNQGQDRGPNTIFTFEIDGVTVGHFGDQGCELEPEQLEKLQGVEVMIAPVGGGLTADPALIWKMAEAIKPNIFIPCHVKTPEIDLPIGPMEDFLAGKENVVEQGASELTIDAGSLPAPIQIVVLERSR